MCVFGDYLNEFIHNCLLNMKLCFRLEASIIAANIVFKCNNFNFGLFVLALRIFVWKYFSIVRNPYS